MRPIRTDRVSFPGAVGGRLAARLERPAEEPTAYVLFAHCFSCTKDLKSVGRISRSLVGHSLGGEAEIQLGGRPFRVKRQLLADLREQTLGEAVGRLDRALLIMHSPADKVVGIDHAERLFAAATHPKSFVDIPDADHLLLKRPEDARYVGTVLAAWSSRYLPERELADVDDDALASA